MGADAANATFHLAAFPSTVTAFTKPRQIPSSTYPHHLFSSAKNNIYGFSKPPSVGYGSELKGKKQVQ